MPENITLEDIMGAAEQSHPIQVGAENDRPVEKILHASEELGKQRREAIEYAIKAGVVFSPDGFLFFAKKIHSYLATGHWEVDRVPQPAKAKPGPKPKAKAKAGPAKKAAKKAIKKVGPGRPTKRK